MPNAFSVICDTGPLVALYSPHDAAQRACREALGAYHGKLLTTWPVITEAFHLLPRQDHRGLFWELILRGGVGLARIEPPDLRRMHDLMKKYADVGMDLADASLVAVAEKLRVTHVFTLDNLFRICRPRHTKAFEVFP